MSQCRSFSVFNSLYGAVSEVRGVLTVLDTQVFAKMFVFLFVCVLCVLAVRSWISMRKDRQKIKLDGPTPLPFIGNAHIFAVGATKFLDVLLNLKESHGDVIIAYLMNKRYLIAYHPKFFEAVVSNVEYNTKGVSYSFLRPWLGQGLLTSSGYRWKSHRKFLTPAFHFNILQNFLPVFCKNTRILVEKLRERADGRTSIDVFPLVALAALDNVTESIMGVCVNAQNDSESKYVRAIEDLSNIISTRMRNPFVGANLIFRWLPHKARQDRALKILHGQTMQVIETRRRELENSGITNLQQSSELGIKNKHAFLDLLLLSEIDGQRIDDDKIREEVDTFMFEGHDTTTSGIAFALYCLSKRRDVQERILKEQIDILGDDVRDPSYSELKEMRYLEAVIKESLRMYPSVPLIERLVTRDSEVAGFHLPKDTSIVIDIYHMQRSADIYECPLEFRPERFLDQDTRNPYSWLAFSAGPRNCIGQKFAMMEMKVALAAIVKKFHILPCDQEPKLVADLILRSQNGVNIKLTSRNVV